MIHVTFVVWSLKRFTMQWLLALIPELFWKQCEQNGRCQMFPRFNSQAQIGFYFC